MRLLLVPSVLLLCGSAWAAPIEVQFRGSEPVSITGLSDDPDCTPAKISGRVAKRVFDDSGVRMSAIVIEERNGERNYVNIDIIKIKEAPAAEASNAIRGLQVILREGNSISAGVIACGAAGRTMYLDNVRKRR